MRLLLFIALVGAAPLAPSAWGQTSPQAAPGELAAAPAGLRAMAAGYKALTVCSAIRNAEANGVTRTLESVEAHELNGIYPELDALVDQMAVKMTAIGTSVGWDPAMPPRVAVHAPGRGCTILPVGASASGAVASARRGPTVDFPTAAPSGDAQAFSEALSRAQDGTYGEGSDTTALVVVQDGRIVGEHYAEGFGPATPQRTWSVAKSLAGTVIGAAVHGGEADVEAPAAIANWQAVGDPRRAITLDNLLRMASGLTSDTAGNRTDGLYFGGVTVDEQAPAWPLIAAPGSQYRYANNDTLLAVLSVAPSFETLSPNALFDRLGMTSTVAETDWRGNYILSSQVWSTARDLARFGMLYVDDGVVDGERILPEDWRDYVSRASGPQPTGEFGYGATFWLMNRSEGVPTDTIAAFGNRGQYVVIVPGRKVVIVRRGEDPAGKRFDIAAFARDVLAALE